jgi:hypothetical protein
MSVWLDISASKATIIVYSIVVATVSFRAAQLFWCAGNHFSMLPSLGGDEDRDGVMATEKILVFSDD